jgi:hypothetical protein
MQVSNRKLLPADTILKVNSTVQKLRSAIHTSLVLMVCDTVFNT